MKQASSKAGYINAKHWYANAMPCAFASELSLAYDVM